MMVDDVLPVGVGSMNLNRRGFYQDGEVVASAIPAKLTATRDNPARKLRTALWAEHLGIDPAMGEALLSDPIAAFELFRRSRYQGSRFTPFAQILVPRTRRAQCRRCWRRSSASRSTSRSKRRCNRSWKATARSCGMPCLTPRAAPIRTPCRARRSTDGRRQPVRSARRARLGLARPSRRGGCCTTSTIRHTASSIRPISRRLRCWRKSSTPRLAFRTIRPGADEGRVGLVAEVHVGTPLPVHAIALTRMPDVEFRLIETGIEPARYLRDARQCRRHLRDRRTAGGDPPAAAHADAAGAQPRRSDAD